MGYIPPVVRNNLTNSSAARSSGAMILLARQVVTSGTTVVFQNVMTSAFNNYMLLIQNVNLAGTAQLTIEFSTNNGSTYLTSYESGAFSSLYNSTSLSNNMTTSTGILTSNAGTTSNTNGRYFISNAASGAGYPMIVGHFNSLVPGTGLLRTGFNGLRASAGSTATLTAIRIANTNTQVFNSGTFTLFGILI